MRDLRRMRRSRTVAVVVVAMVVAVVVGVGVGMSHRNMLYYNITEVHAGPATASRSRGRYARALLRIHALQKEGAGKTGCALHPRSRALLAQKEMHTSIQVQREHSAFPAQWLYGLWRALPGERAFLPPSLGGSPRKA
jgi:hypothetical protein